MNLNKWQWTAAELDSGKVNTLSDSLGLHRLTASRLVELGLDTPERAALFLRGSLADLADPFAMSGIYEAVDRLETAIRQGETILVYGDYDADGITATALLVRFLRCLGLNPMYRLPSRLEEGYGLHTGMLEDFAAAGQLVITVDCGSNDFAAFQRAKELGLDLVVTDHHQVQAGDRDFCAFVNPRQPGCAYPDKDLAGVGVAYVLVRALGRRLNLPPGAAEEYLDLAALGTVADVAPLGGENRILVRHGLRQLACHPKPGLLALAARAGLDLSRDITARQTAFALVPRLNAPGRLGDALPSLELLLTDCPEEAVRRVAEIDSANRRRQQAEAAILATAREQAAGRGDDPGLVLWHEDWHPGVVGIVAGRLAEEMARPVVLVALYNGEGRGSGRSVEGYDLLSSLEECAPLLIRYGGHREAAGVTVEPSLLSQFRDAFCCSLVSAKGTFKKPPVATACASLAELSLDLVREINLLEPYGHGNPEPVFMAREVEAVAARAVGSLGKHLQLKLRQGNRSAAAIFFGAGGKSIPPGDVIDCVFTVRENIWQEQSSLSLHLRDLNHPDYPQLPVVIDRRCSRDRDNHLWNLTAEKRVWVWTNTRAAAEGLSARLPGATLSHLGRTVPRGEYGAVVFYHLPYDRTAVENVLTSFSAGLPPVHLLYGSEDLDLNEKIFAAGIPDSALLVRLAPYLREISAATAEHLQNKLPFTLTRKILDRARQVIRELEEGGEIVPASLNRSHTFREGQKLLSDFRTYQNFWLTANIADLARHLQKLPVLPEALFYESKRTKRTN